MYNLDFMLALLVFVVLLTLVLAALHFIILFDIVFGGHDFATSGLGIKKVAEILKHLEKQNGIVYDLGSARGGFAVGLMMTCPNLRVVGVDNSRLRIFFSRLRAWLFNRPAQFICGDIFSANISSADAVYIYLDKSLMPALQKKLQSELKTNSIVITNTQYLPDWPPLEAYVTHLKKPAYEKMFVYVKR